MKALQEELMQINVGERFHQAFMVTDEIYNGFIELFKDKNPLHTNADFARSKGFEAEVMHGNILGGFLSYFIGECLPLKNVIIHKQEIKYLKPVYMNKPIEFEAIVKAVHESVHATEFKFLFKNQDGIKLAKGTVQIGTI